MFLFCVVGSGKWRLSNWNGGCWDLLGFLFCCVFCCLAHCPGKIVFLGRENHFFKLESGGCWDFFFCGVYCCLADCRAKNDVWVGKIIFLKLETSDCWDLLGFLLLRCPGKTWFLGRENHFSEAIAGICWDFFFCGVYTAACKIAGQGEWRLLGFLLLRCPGKKWFLGRENHFSEAIAGICWDFFFCGVYTAACKIAGQGEWRLLGFLLLRCPGKKWFLGRENHFSEAIAGICWDFFFCGVYTAACKIAGQGEWRLLGFAGISSFAVSIPLLARLPGKESGGCWDLLGFLLLRCLLLLGRLPGKNKIFGSGKSFFWNWRRAIAEICLDFSFFALLGRLITLVKLETHTDCQRDWLY